jgi:MBG domain (YGX type)/Right handed beta helix region/PKD domain/Matrixin
MSREPNATLLEIDGPTDYATRLVSHIMNKRSTTRNPIAARSTRNAQRRRLLSMEWLEDRKLLTTFTVINTNDSGVGSLRDAIASASTGTNSIVFDPTVFATPQTILLTTTNAPLTLTDTTGTDTITGPAAGVTISGGGATGVFAVNSGVTAMLSGLTITGGNAANGGGVHNLGNTTLTNSTLTGNTTAGSGGAVFSSGTLTLTNDTLTSNTTASTNGSEGGAVFSSGTLNVTNSTITSNTSFFSGGGVFTSGTSTLTDCTISGNTSTVDRGGGVYNYGLSATVTLNGDTLSGNYASYRGGGFGNMLGHAALTDCTISGNSLSLGSASGGGGTFNKYGTTTLTNCTIASNTSAGGFKAGGVFNVSGTTSLIDCTVSGNIGQSASNGTGILNQTGTTNLVNTIVAGTVGHTDVEGTFTSQGNNLIGNIGGSSVSFGWVGSDLTGTPTALLNAQLGPLANNGGPTQTEALLPTSPALNHGNAALAPTTDERGLTRFGNTDIGAYEDDFKVFTTADSGAGSLRQAIANANTATGANTVVFTSLFNTPQTITLTSGQLTLSNSTGTETITGPAVGVTVSGNHASRVFGINTGVTANLSELTITAGNAGGGSGGGVDSSGSLTMTNSVITGNTAGTGGGLTLYHGSGTLIDCVVSGNSAIATGGGLYFRNAAATLTNTTVSSNTSAGISGGIFSGNGTTTLIDCTVNNNSASTNTGGVGSAGTVTLSNTIVAGNTSPSSPDVIGTFISNGSNLIGIVTGGSSGWVSSDLQGTTTSPINPQLAALANNGGPVPTEALLPNSPAINAGTSASAPTTDARGLTRFGSTDIGAFEYQFKVTTTANSGNGSLRQAITNANATTGTDTVVFKIGTGGLQTISPTSALPTITDTIVIDGMSTPGFVNNPLIQISGSSAGNVNGLTLGSGSNGSTIKDLIIRNFSSAAGIDLSGTTNSTIQGNWIGLNSAGTAAAGNFNGIVLGGGNLIGTNGDGVNDTAERNVISGNSNDGLFTSGGNNNKIAGNYIGTNFAGNAPINNTAANVFIANSDGNIIGVDGSNAADERNVINGGILVSRSTVIAGNYIGLNAAGTAALSTVGNVGILFGNPTVGARIGTNGDGIADAVERNVISGLNGNGIVDAGAGSLVIAGNYIGTDFTGTSAIPDKVGIQLKSSATGVRIGTNGIDVDAAAEGNVISGNTTFGVEISSTSSGNIVAGNTIGLNAAGTAALANATGVLIDTSSSNNTIGGTTALTANVISGNTSGGLEISTGSHNLVEGNRIGTGRTGTLALGNTQFGIQLSSAPNNTIGGMTTGASNTIAATKVLTGSPTSGWGIDVVGSASSGSVIQGNTIGGLPGFGNAGIGIFDDLATITIGGIAPGEGNVIGFNAGFGVSLTSTGSADSEVRQNSFAGNTAGGISIGVSGAAYNRPVLTETTIIGNVLEVKGTALPGAVLEFYLAGSGQGATFLGTTTEGSVADNNPVAGTFDISMVMPLGVTATAGNSITAISVATPISTMNPTLQNTTSTFALAVAADSGPAFGAPVVNAGGGGTIVAGSTFTSQGTFTDKNSQSWTANVDYGDGTGVHPLTINPVTLSAAGSDDYSQVASATFNLSHLYAKTGTYPVVVSVTNDSNLVGTSSFSVNVAAAPPTVNNTDIQIAPANNLLNVSSPTIINENGSVVLTGKFTDVNPGTTHTVTIIWGDGIPSTATVNEAAGTFTATHQYLSPGTLNSASSVYTVKVTVDSTAGTTASTQVGLFYVQVNNVLPSNLTLTTDQSPINEGGTFHVGGSFSDPGTNDAHVVTIDWGDKSPATTLALLPGVLTFPAIPHQYLDYAPGAAGTPYTISVSVNDLYQPLAPVKATTTVLVNPVKATQVVLTAAPSTISQGQSIALSGSFVAPGTLDHHIVSINWGDGTSSTVVPLGAGVTTFTGINHTYAGNSLNQAADDFKITATVTDPARPIVSDPGMTTVVVNDVAPTVSNLAVTFAGGGAIPIVPQTGGGTAPQVNAGSKVTLTGRFTTPNPDDTYSLLVSWGDGTTSTVPTSYLASHTFTASHLFADSAPGTLLSLDDIHVTVTDLEHTTGSGDLPLAVAHVAPVVQIGSGGFDTTTGSQVLSAQISGGDTSPISYTWKINGVTQANTTANQPLPTTMDTTFMVESTATDSKGASSHFMAQVDVLDNTTSTFTIPAPAAPVNAVFVSALAGNHTVDGSALSVPIVFDGTGQEKYIGDSAPDVFNLHTDQSMGIGNGGNNVFNLTPNCTLFAVANGGQNTLNFSSSTYGVTFDLSQTDGTTQDVDPINAPGDHFVSVLGMGGATFPTLVDSSGGGDTITAASNTTIVGMGGSNKVLVNSSASTAVGNVTVMGAADGDTLTTSGPSIGPINFQGDSGVDTLTNMGTVTGAINFTGGADAGTLTNLGTIAGTVTFGGGADGGMLINMGTVTGTVVFGGGSDADSLVNGANAILGSVVFNGDQGGDSFLNSGTVGIITFNGGADTDSFMNSVSGTVGTITFNGGSDAGTLTNDGMVTGSVTYNGGSDAGLLTNNGTVTGTVTFGGGSDADSFMNSLSGTVGSIVFTGGSDAGTLTNDGTVTGSIMYTGGSDAGTLTNDGMVFGSITYTGGSDTSLLTNDGTVAGSISFTGGSDAGLLTNNGAVTGTVTFGGGSDADSFMNSVGASVGSISFTGGADAGLLTNDGMVTGSVTYKGGSDAGSLLNNGTIIGSVTYNGGSDADSFSNLGTIVGGVTYIGGSDAGTFMNGGTVTGTVTYTSGADSDSFTNTGTLGTVLYTGGSDASTLLNTGAFGTITYVGGSDADTLTNTGTVGAGTIDFLGDSGVDNLVNLGTLAGVVYTGGSDSDTLLNPGTVTGTIVFNGDSGADLLENGATVNGVLVPGTVGSITFNAGSDTDLLLNPGVVTGAIVFNGDTGADELLNTLGSSVGSITFNGGSDTNLLVNEATGVGSIVFNAGGDANVLNNDGSGFGTISFKGDGGTDYLVNTGSALGGSTSTITFNGGADTGTLINTGSGLGSITFNGDEGSSTLINEGSNIGLITFGAGADGGSFLNAGDSVATITFTGGADANVFGNDGSMVGTINYNGDEGSGFFLNNGSVATINYAAGSDTDILINNGMVGTSNGGTTTGGINFSGDTGADGLLNTANGTINGLVFTGGSDTDQLENQGTLFSASLNFQGDKGAGQFLNDLSGTASNVTYNAGSDTDALVNFGSLSNATYNGDIGAGTMYLDGTLNQNITYNGGADGDTLLIGPDAGVASTINFNGDAGTDLLQNQANGAQNITFQAGSDTANFWNFANNVNGLTFHGGSGADSFDNFGTGVTGIVFDAKGDSGADSLYNSGAGVGTIVFTGGSDANTLTNTGTNTVSITYNAGSDTDTLTNTGAGVQTIAFNGDDGVDSLVNSGTDVGTITYTGGSDADSLTNSGTVGTITFLGDGPAATFTDSGSVQNLVFNGGAGTASLIYSAIGAPGSSVTFTGQGGGNIFVDSGSASSITANLGSGNNQAVVMTGAAGNVEIIGGSGNNTYLFSGTPTAKVTVDQGLFADAGSMSVANNTPVFVTNPTNPTGSGGGVNTLDFSGYTGGGISLDLMNTVPQAMGGGLMLTLTDPEGISDVVGTQYTDQIYGNLRPDVISTADLPDFRLAGQVSPASNASFTPDARTQYVFLDFDSNTVAGDHVYTTDERATILNRIEMDYYGPDPSNPNLPDFANRWFDVVLTDNKSDIPSNLVSTGQYATLYFNRTPPSGLPGGEASEVDLGNTDFGGFASIQINGMVGGGGQPPAIDRVTSADNFAILSAKIGAHELGHLMGIRHSDAFGPIGFGIHTPPGTTEFNPTYDGPDAAFETFDHLISSPATVGSDRFNDLRDLDFGPREAIKLAFASRGTTIVAPTGTHSSIGTAEPITLAPLAVPNTDVNLPDVEKGLNFQVAALDVQGTIGLDPTTHLAGPDYYAITGQKGDIDSFEVDSQELGRLDGQNTIDSVLTVYDSSGNIIAFNDDQYEGTDSLLLDVTLPANGTYYVKITSFAAPVGDPEYDPTNPQSPLNPGNLDSILNPLNTANFSQSALTSFLAAQSGTATGHYDLFIYLFGESDPTVADTHNVLVARSAGTTLSGASGTDVFMGPVGTVLDDSDAGPGSTISITPAVSNPSVDLQSHFQDFLTIAGSTGTAPWNVTISYGDGSASTVEQVAAGSAIGLDHLYQATGNDTVTVEIQTSEGTFETSLPVSVILAQVPTEAITSPASGAQDVSNQAVTFSGTLQNPYVGVNYLATWTFINTANPSQVLTTSQMISTATATNSLAFSTSETFTTPGNYSVQLTITDLANSTTTTVQTIGGGTASVNIVQFIATTTTVTAPNATYNGKVYGRVAAKVIGSDQSILSSPAVTFAYYQGTDSDLTSPLSYVPINVGNYLVVATYAGNAAYSPSSSQPVAFSIGQATLTVTINDASKVYGVSDAAALTGTITGLQNNDAITASFASLGSVATANTGSYSITASLSGNATTLADYAVTYTNTAGTKTTGTLTVTAAPLTVTIADASKVYGINDAASLTGTIVGLQNNDAITASFASTGSAATANVGTYSITASLSGSATTLADYAITYTNSGKTQTSGTLTVNPDHTTTSVTSASGSSLWNTSVTFTAIVANSDSTVSPLGSVEFFDGTTDLGHGTLGSSSGNQTTWTFTTSTLTPGSHGITAIYTPAPLAIGADFLASSALPYAEVIQGGPTTTTGSASSTTIFYGKAETFTATVKVGSTPASGTVDFFDTTTGTDLGSMTLNSSGVATLTPSVPLPAGTQSIALNFAGGNGFTASSATVSVVVQASIYVLNATAAGALNLSGSSTISVPGMVQVDSSSSMAIVLSGNTKITAQTIGEVGGKSITGSSSIVGTQSKGTSVPDPLGSLPIPPATGLMSHASVNIGGVTSLSIPPGIYSSITVGGSANLMLQPGIYVITGGGFSLSGAGSVTGTGVFIYNAGSNYNGGSGSTFGSFNLSSGTISLSPLTSGPYAGISLFQSRDNTKALSISGAVATGLGGGVIYAPSATLQLSGSAQIGTLGQSVSSLIVNELILTGNTGAYQLDSGSSTSGSDSSFNWITDPVLTIAAEDDTGQGLDPNELADLGDAMAYLNQALESFGVNLSWAAPGTNADVTVHFASTSPGGGVGDGVLGFTTSQNDVYFVTGWNYYTASDPSQIGAGQYDFTTLAIHELGHTIGLGESQDPNSVMYEYLSSGTVRRTFTDFNLTLIDTDADRFMKVAHGEPTATETSGSTALTTPIALTTLVVPSSLRMNIQALDLALATLDPTPDAALSLSNADVHRLDAAIEAVVGESYFVPLEIAQDFPSQDGNDASPGSIRKPTTHIA